MDDQILDNPKPISNVQNVHSSPLGKKVQFSNSKTINLNIHPFRELLFSKKITQKAFISYLQELHSKLQIFRKKIEFSEAAFNSKKVMLPKMRNANLKSLFLDLDETIIYISNELGEIAIDNPDTEEKSTVKNFPQTKTYKYFEAEV
jgi:hypothetical protein